MKRLLTALVILMVSSLCAFAADSDFEKRVEHGYADSGGVKIHYASLGPKSGANKAPLIVMIHGFPDYWYTGRRSPPQIPPTQLVAGVWTFQPL